MKTLIAFLIACSLATLTVSAASTQKQFVLSACTADKVLANSDIVIDDDAPVAIAEEIKAAYAKVGSSLDFSDFSDRPGFKAFAEALSNSDKEAILAITQPTNAGTCK